MKKGVKEMSTKIKVKLPWVAKNKKIGDVDVLELDGEEAGKVEIVDIKGDWVTLKILEEDKYNKVVWRDPY